MFDIKDVKKLKKIIYLAVFIIVATGIFYSANFLYNNFYKTINWEGGGTIGINQKNAIKQVNMEKMKEVRKKIEKNNKRSSRDEFNIFISFR